MAEHRLDKPDIRAVLPSTSQVFHKWVDKQRRIGKKCDLLKLIRNISSRTLVPEWTKGTIKHYLVMPCLGNLTV
jgi:hypothetical protein